MGAGFLGGIVGGVLAGLAARWISSWKVPRWLRGLMPVVIMPLLGSIIASGLMFLVLGGPIAKLTVALNAWLSGMTGTAAVALGLILGLMMAVDLGGPVNKVAYSFAVAGLGAGSIAENPAPLMIMAAVMAAGMVPAAGHGPGHGAFTKALHRVPSARTARPPGCWAPPSSPRAPSRSPPPTRCASSRPRWSAAASPVR